MEYHIDSALRQAVQNLHIAVAEIENACGAAYLVYRVRPLCQVAQNQFLASGDLLPKLLQLLGEFDNEEPC